MKISKRKLSLSIRRSKMFGVAFGCLAVLMTLDAVLLAEEITASKPVKKNSIPELIKAVLMPEADFDFNGPENYTFNVNNSNSNNKHRKIVINVNKKTFENEGVKPKRFKITIKKRRLKKKLEPAGSDDDADDVIGPISVMATASDTENDIQQKTHKTDGVIKETTNVKNEIERNTNDSISGKSDQSIYSEDNFEQNTAETTNQLSLIRLLVDNIKQRTSGKNDEFQSSENDIEPNQIVTNKINETKSENDRRRYINYYEDDLKEANKRTNCNDTKTAEHDSEAASVVLGEEAIDKEGVFENPETSSTASAVNVSINKFDVNDGTPFTEAEESPISITTTTPDDVVNTTTLPSSSKVECDAPEKFLDVVYKLLELLNQSLNYEKLDLKKVHLVLDTVTKYYQDNALNQSDDVQKEIANLENQLHKEVKVRQMIAEAKSLMDPGDYLNTAPNIVYSKYVDNADNIKKDDASTIEENEEEFDVPDVAKLNLRSSDDNGPNEQSELFRYEISVDAKTTCKDAYRKLMEVTAKAYSDIADHQACSNLQENVGSNNFTPNLVLPYPPSKISGLIHSRPITDVHYMPDFNLVSNNLDALYYPHGNFGSRIDVDESVSPLRSIVRPNTTQPTVNAEEKEPMLLRTSAEREFATNPKPAQMLADHLKESDTANKKPITGLFEFQPNDVPNTVNQTPSIVFNNEVHLSPKNLKPYMQPPKHNSLDRPINDPLLGTGSLSAPNGLPKQYDVMHNNLPVTNIANPIPFGQTQQHYNLLPPNLQLKLQGQNPEPFLPGHVVYEKNFEGLTPSVQTQETGPIVWNGLLNPIPSNRLYVPTSASNPLLHPQLLLYGGSLQQPTLHQVPINGQSLSQYPQIANSNNQLSLPKRLKPDNFSVDKLTKTPLMLNAQNFAAYPHKTPMNLQKPIPWKSSPQENPGAGLAPSVNGLKPLPNHLQNPGNPMYNLQKSMVLNNQQPSYTQETPNQASVPNQDAMNPLFSPPLNPSGHLNNQQNPQVPLNAQYPLPNQPQSVLMTKQYIPTSVPSPGQQNPTQKYLYEQKIVSSLNPYQNSNWNAQKLQNPNSLQQSPLLYQQSSMVAPNSLGQVVPGSKPSIYDLLKQETERVEKAHAKQPPPEMSTQPLNSGPPQNNVLYHEQIKLMLLPNTSAPTPFPVPNINTLYKAQPGMKVRVENPEDNIITFANQPQPVYNQEHAKPDTDAAEIYPKAIQQPYAVNAQLPASIVQQNYPLGHPLNMKNLLYLQRYFGLPHQAVPGNANPVVNPNLDLYNINPNFNPGYSDSLSQVPVAETPAALLYQQRFLNPSLDQKTNNYVPSNSPNLVNSQQWGMTNAVKSNMSPTPSDFVELTYVINRPQPMVYSPYYYVKYRIPYKYFLNDLQKNLISNPYLRTKPAELFSELIPKSKMTEVSDNLKNYPANALNELVSNNGTLTKAKLVSQNGEVLNRRLKEGQIDQLLEVIGIDNNQKENAATSTDDHEEPQALRNGVENVEKETPSEPSTLEETPIPNQPLQESLGLNPQANEKPSLGIAIDAQSLSSDTIAEPAGYSQYQINTLGMTSQEHPNTSYINPTLSSSWPSLIEPGPLNTGHPVQYNAALPLQKDISIDALPNTDPSPYAALKPETISAPTYTLFNPSLLNNVKSASAYPSLMSQVPIFTPTVSYTYLRSKGLPSPDPSMPNFVQAVSVNPADISQGPIFTPSVTYTSLGSGSIPPFNPSVPNSIQAVKSESVNPSDISQSPIFTPSVSYTSLSSGSLPSSNPSMPHIVKAFKPGNANPAYVFQTPILAPPVSHTSLASESLPFNPSMPNTVKSGLDPAYTQYQQSLQSGPLRYSNVHPIYINSDQLNPVYQDQFQAQKRNAVLGSLLALEEERQVIQKKRQERVKKLQQRQAYKTKGF